MVQRRNRRRHHRLHRHIGFLAVFPRLSSLFLTLTHTRALTPTRTNTINIPRLSLHLSYGSITGLSFSFSPFIQFHLYGQRTQRPKS